MFVSGVYFYLLRVISEADLSVYTYMNLDVLTASKVQGVRKIQCWIYAVCVCLCVVCVCDT